MALSLAGFAFAEGPAVIGGQGGIGGQKGNYLDAVKDCAAQTDPRNPAVDSVYGCMAKLDNALNADGTVVVDPIHYIRSNMKEWVQSQKGTSEGTVDAVIRATAKTITEIEDGDVAKELAVAKLLADKIRDRITFDRCKGVPHPEYVAGCYDFNPEYAPLHDPDEGIELSPDSVELVCKDDKIGGDTVCAATYAHEIAHLLQRTKPGYNPKAVRDNEEYAFFYEFKLLDQVVSYTKNKPRLAALSLGERSQRGAVPDEDIRKFNAFMDAFSTVMNGAKDADGKIVRTYPDPVKKYYEHLWKLLMTDGDRGKIRELVASLGYKDRK